MATLKTLLSVTDSTGNDTFSFMVTHSHGVNAATAVIHAFNEYAKTPAGKKYIKNNGSNWNDALFITPKEYLIEQGILSVKRIDADYRTSVNYHDSLLQTIGYATRKC